MEQVNKDKLLRQYAIAIENANANDMIAKGHRADAHRLLRELHGIPEGTQWRLRISRGMPGARREVYDAVLEDVRAISYYSRPEEKPWATAFRIKNDGTPEKQSRSVYTDWEVIGPYEAPK